MWKYIKEELPREGKKVLIFRDSIGKYTIGKFRINKDEYGYNNMFWVTDYGNTHPVVSDDQWYEFEYAVKMIVCE